MKVGALAVRLCSCWAMACHSGRPYHYRWKLVGSAFHSPPTTRGRRRLTLLLVRQAALPLGDAVLAAIVSPPPLFRKGTADEGAVKYVFEGHTYAKVRRHIPLEAMRGLQAAGALGGAGPWGGVRGGGDACEFLLNQADYLSADGKTAGGTQQLEAAMERVRNIA